MELFKDGKRYKDFYLKVTVDGKEVSKEYFDSNELHFRLMGRPEIFRKLFGGKILAYVRSEEDYTTTIGWNEVGKTFGKFTPANS